jgi:Ca2+-transporting ATPase
LIGASIVTAVLKDYSDAAIIFGVVFENAIIGYLQESKAEKAIEALKHAMTAEAIVVRDGKQMQIAAERLVVGDIVLLQAGDKVPADLRIIESRDLQIAEAALTGESVPISKNAAVVLSEDTVLAERVNMAFASTLVTYGTAKGIVVRIGDSTEVGLISQLISETETLETPLTRKITQFSNSFLMVILVFALISFLINIFRSGSLSPEYIGETLKAAIALSVAAIPEGLPAAVTITLAIGVTRMAQKRAIIRKLPAVETLGSVTVICSDKTGTLTQNQMTVQRIVAGNQANEVDGIGYVAEGEIKLADRDANEEVDEENIRDNAALRETLLAGLLCNDSSLFFKDGEWQMNGDPTEAALIVSAIKGGFKEEVKQNFPRLDSLPFDSAHQYMATLHANKDSGEGVIYIKGAVEKILERCVYALDQQGKEVLLDKDEIQQEVARSAANGLRYWLLHARMQPLTKESYLMRM